MTTPRTRSVVSLAVTTTVIVLLGACARPQSSPALDGLAPVASAPLSIRFDNDDREYVHVYLVGPERQWYLGRVEPGAVAILKIPQESLLRNSQYMQLAVIMGDRLTVDAKRNPRATLTVVQPAAAMMSQQWRFDRGELMSRKVPRGAGPG